MEYVRLDAAEEIRKVLDDFDDVFERHLHTRIADMAAYAAKLQKNARIYKIQEDEKTAGFFAFYANDPEGKMAYLTQIAIKQGYREKGLGSRALNYICQVCAKEGFSILQLEVDRKNEQAIRFYRMNGFYMIEKETKESYYMEKELTDVSVEQEGNRI